MKLTDEELRLLGEVIVRYPCSGCGRPNSVRGAAYVTSPVHQCMWCGRPHEVRGDPAPAGASEAQDDEGDRGAVRAEPLADGGGAQ